MYLFSVPIFSVSCQSSKMDCHHNFQSGATERISQTNFIGNKTEVSSVDIALDEESSLKVQHTETPVDI